MRRRRGESGFALFLAILLLLILTVIGIALLFTASTERSLSGNETKVSKVFYAACSGVDFATSRLAMKGGSTCTDSGAPGSRRSIE